VSTGPILTLGRYSVYAPIASGGMATVHLGRLAGPAGFARTVAIKRLHTQFAQDPEFVAMFLDEARVAARIRHPNVVPTLDVVAKENELFLVMEYVEGDSISRLTRAVKAREENIPIPILAAAMSSVLHGLHAAHEARTEQGEPLGIVHRDVSPQNIIIGRDGISRIFDFGVAKAVGRLQTTREGQIKGKLGYMAPELFQGARATRQVDIYGAAVVLWEVLTSTRLFAGDHEADVMGRILRGEVPAPTRKDEVIPPALVALVKRGLDLDPTRRFPTARDMALALEAAVPLAIPSAIGTWVEEVAGDILAQRAARVAEIESDSSNQGNLLGAADVVIPIVDGSPTQTTSLSVTTGPRRLQSRKRAVIGVVGALAVTGAATATWFGVSRSSKTASIATGSASTSVTASSPSAAATTPLVVLPVTSIASTTAPAPTTKPIQASQRHSPTTTTPATRRDGLFVEYDTKDGGH